MTSNPWSPKNKANGLPGWRRNRYQGSSKSSLTILWKKRGSKPVPIGRWRLCVTWFCGNGGWILQKRRGTKASPARPQLDSSHLHPQKSGFPERKGIFRRDIPEPKKTIDWWSRSPYVRGRNYDPGLPSHRLHLISPRTLAKNPHLRPVQRGADDRHLGLWNQPDHLLRGRDMWRSGVSPLFRADITGISHCQNLDRTG